MEILVCLDQGNYLDKRYVAIMMNISPNCLLRRARRKQFLVV